MVDSLPRQLSDTLQSELAAVLDQLPSMKHGKLIRQVLETILEMMGRETERLDWKILSSALQDMEKGFRIFYPYRHTRKITIFGSARLSAEHPAYQMAQTFAQEITQLGFMVITGAGGGIMEAGNAGAGTDQSFGLNIQLPFEQGANPVISGDPKLIDFKYFFTRKLFFLKESDALALFPGGFGTQDEAFESLTLIQTGKAGPLPVVLVDYPGGDYWHNWDQYIRKQLMADGLISPDDVSLYTITDSVTEACAAVTDFYRVFHSSRYVDDQLVLRLKCPLPPSLLDTLNVEFSDILHRGTIRASTALPVEKGDETEDLPRLILHFNYRDLGRLYQMIRLINQLGVHSPETDHPEEK
ncbi:LOG family protein [Leptolyngbya sp. PCC 6406]|uniref:LOG family protein n=1 Tax=Leptolyngbya sp. PCC 6406 TaxID=1173264 RepID=UPI0002AC5026|nr:LOG family protein [Leptolyngbya sp. PCC 6406]